MGKKKKSCRQSSCASALNILAVFCMTPLNTNHKASLHNAMKYVPSLPSSIQAKSQLKTSVCFLGKCSSQF